MLRLNSINCGNLHMHTGGINDVAQKFYTAQEQGTSLWMKGQLVASQKLEHSMQYFMVASLIPTKDQNAIQIHHHKIIQKVKEHQINDILKGLQCNHEAKCHNCKLEGAIATGNGSFLSVICCYL